MGMPKDILPEIQLLIFDLDGTLADTKTDLALAVNAMRDKLSLAPLSHDTVASYVGQGVTSLVRHALADENTAASATDEKVEKAIAIFLDHYRHHMLDHTVIYPGVREALAELRDRRLAVLSNKPVGFSREMLAGLGVAHFFSFIYGGNSFDQKKPDPVGVAALMRDTGIPASQTMIIGDSDTDVLTGRNAGVWTCGVTYGFGAQTLAACPPDLLLSDLRELPPLLNSGNRSQGLSAAP